MPKFLVKGSYTAAGAKGLLKEGGSGRRASVQKAFEPLGVKIEAMYFAFGDADVYAICDAPDAATIAAMSLNASAAGGVRISTIPLITVEEMDAATKKKVAYRAPGA